MALQHPVVCEQIGHRPLYLGSSRAAAEGVIDEKFSHVITVSSYSQPRTTEFIPLVDGPELDYSQFKQAVETIRQYYRQREPILVHCEVGISRSAAVIATTLAAEEHKSFEEALEEVKQYRRRASPRKPLRKCAKRYLQETKRQKLIV
jgi:atypical dual specificity phosphatase